MQHFYVSHLRIFLGVGRKSFELPCTLALLCQLDEKIPEIRVKGYEILDMISKY